MQHLHARLLVDGHTSACYSPHMTVVLQVLRLVVEMQRSSVIAPELVLLSAVFYAIRSATCTFFLVQHLLHQAQETLSVHLHHKPREVRSCMHAVHIL